jgi:hypothetical protein
MEILFSCFPPCTLRTCAWRACTKLGSNAPNQSHLSLVNFHFFFVAGAKRIPLVRWRHRWCRHLQPPASITPGDNRVRWFLRPSIRTIHCLFRHSPAPLYSRRRPLQFLKIPCAQRRQASRKRARNSVAANPASLSVSIFPLLPCASPWHAVVSTPTPGRRFHDWPDLAVRDLNSGEKSPANQRTPRPLNSPLNAPRRGTSIGIPDGPPLFLYHRERVMPRRAVAPPNSGRVPLPFQEEIEVAKVPIVLGHFQPAEANAH